MEELKIHATIGDHFMTVEHDYPELRIRLLVYHAETADAITQSTDHDQLVWILPQKYEQYALAEADVPVLKKLTGLLQRG